MHSIRRLLHLFPKLSSSSSSFNSQIIKRNPLSTTTNRSRPSSSSLATSTGDDEWNDAWETAWLPDDPSTESGAPWESDASLPSSSSPSSPSPSSAADVTSSAPPSEIDADTKAFVVEMDERWNERRAAKKSSSSSSSIQKSSKKDVDEYRVKKQRIHASLWMKEIEKLEEDKLGNPTAAGDDIDRLLDSCSEYFVDLSDTGQAPERREYRIFDSGNIDMSDSKIPSTSEFKSKPDGWETATKGQDGNIWEISQREEDILLQEFERRIAFSKFQIASFIKSHIFSRRRPIDGWKYMIEELGPNAKRGKGSVQRLPSLTDPATQPFKEERPAIASNLTSNRGRR